MIPEQVWDQPEPRRLRVRRGHRLGDAAGVVDGRVTCGSRTRSTRAGRSRRPRSSPTVTPRRAARRRRAAGHGAGRGRQSPREPTVDGARHDERAASSRCTPAGTTTGIRHRGRVHRRACRSSLGANTITVVAVGADGGTAAVQRTVTSTNFGTRLGTVADPSATTTARATTSIRRNSAFNPGAYRPHAVRRLRRRPLDTTSSRRSRGEILNPWGGNQMSVQRLEHLHERGCRGRRRAGAARHEREPRARRTSS